jgi:hypothetical protein
MKSGWVIESDVTVATGSSRCLKTFLTVYQFQRSSLPREYAILLVPTETLLLFTTFLGLFQLYELHVVQWYKNMLFNIKCIYHGCSSFAVNHENLTSRRPISVTECYQRLS